MKHKHDWYVIQLGPDAWVKVCYADRCFKQKAIKDPRIKRSKALSGEKEGKHE